MTPAVRANRGTVGAHAAEVVVAVNGAEQELPR